MSARVAPKYTLEEYFELERTSEERYEYFDGDVFCMSGVSLPHSQIEGNIYLALRLALRERGCRVYTANARVKVPSMPPYRYPDLSVVCGQVGSEEIGGVQTLTNPMLLVEVLSPSTEAFDRGDKFTYYKSIESFREYLLVAQHRPHITHYIRRDEGGWSYEEVNDLAATIQLPTINCSLALSDVYIDVDFNSVG